MGVLGTLRRHVAPVAKRALLHGGVHAALRRVLPSRQFGILRYHAVCEPSPDGYAEPLICVSPSAFEQHVAYLASRYQVLSLPAAVAALRRGEQLPPNAIAITFDDGYADNLPAANTLARHGLTATFYITAGCMHGGQPFWPAEIRYLLRACTAPLLELAAGGRVHRIPMVSPAERERAVHAVTRLMKAHPIPLREHLRDQLRRAAGDPPIPKVMLSWTELVEMRRLGMTIGAHTVTHANLPSAGLDAASAEIAGSKARLERELQAPVTMFSYPNGGAERYFTPQLQRVVREAGFEAATTSRNGFAGPASDLYALERIHVREPLEELVFALEVERFAFQPNA